MLFEPANLSEQKAKIVVVGVGGGGGNALNRMISDGMNSVEFIAINTDAQDLENNNSQKKLQIGKELTKGLGAGANSEIGKEAVKENKEVILKELGQADMIFITAGMGGGTGTGAAPEIAKLSKEIGALTVGIVTKPFAFEGPIRKKRALEGIKEMKKNCDTLLIIPNETLLEIASDDTTVNQSFQLADTVLNEATKGISDLINKPGLINLDFADVSTIMRNMGDAIMGSGSATGEEKAILAAQQAINSPLLQNASIKGAKGLLVNVSGPKNMKMKELDEASNIIYQESGEDANVILGCVIDDNLNDEIKITVIATGLNNNEQPEFYDNSQEENIRNKYLMHSTTVEETKEDLVNNQEMLINNESNQIAEKETDENEQENKESKESKENLLQFGENLDIPTFLRNRKI
ncbi:MAG: cell division protein FtsZ [Candidatus Marinimicrobia bacterium]|nr:cell division protein FtsZ [Candidatus Neomarinimicrobiota bacterium]|tara:strand:+ start:1832 stop:3055 length:1224 start_codon:yes stop_codon:yes gene_type:complete